MALVYVYRCLYRGVGVLFGEVTLGTGCGILYGEVTLVALVCVSLFVSGYG